MDPLQQYALWRRPLASSGVVEETSSGRGRRPTPVSVMLSSHVTASRRQAFRADVDLDVIVRLTRGYECNPALPSGDLALSGNMTKTAFCLF